MTAKQTAAEVLAEHTWSQWKTCQCGQRFAERLPQHQADMLRAAGLLATAEHDAQVLRDAADAMHGDGELADMFGGYECICGDHSWSHLEPHCPARGRLLARADRIAGGGT